MNALKYGLTARTVVLPNENAGEYNSLLDSYIQDLQPTGPVEMEGCTVALLVRSEVLVPMMLVAKGGLHSGSTPNDSNVASTTSRQTCSSNK